MKPDDVNQEAWDVVINLGLYPVSDGDIAYLPSDDLATIARAIMAAKAEEREACAEMAELVGIPMAANGSQVLMIPVRIAERIRSRT